MRPLVVLICVVVASASVTGCAKRHRDGDRTTPVVVARGDSAGIRIESARYGRDDTWVDVTSQVRGLVSGDTLVFPRNMVTTLNVDPVPGRMKYLDMVIIIDGRVVELTVGDSLHVTPLRLRAAGGGGGGGGGAGAGSTTRPQ